MELGAEVFDYFFAGFGVHGGDNFWTAHDDLLGPGGIQYVEYKGFIFVKSGLDVVYGMRQAFENFRHEGAEIIAYFGGFHFFGNAVACGGAWDEILEGLEHVELGIALKGSMRKQNKFIPFSSSSPISFQKFPPPCAARRISGNG